MHAIDKNIPIFLAIETIYALSITPIAGNSRYWASQKVYHGKWWTQIIRINIFAHCWRKLNDSDPKPFAQESELIFLKLRCSAKIIRKFLLRVLIFLRCKCFFELNLSIRNKLTFSKGKRLVRSETKSRKMIQKAGSSMRINSIIYYFSLAVLWGIRTS